jgi:hypothetical protein
VTLKTNIQLKMIKKNEPSKPGSTCQTRDLIQPNRDNSMESKLKKIIKPN